MSRKTNPNPKPINVPADGMPLSVPQFAAKYGVGDATVWSWIAQGLLVATKVGPNITRILPEHESAWLAMPKASAEAQAATNREKNAA